MKKCSWLYLIAIVCFLPYLASALVMRENGPEPIIIQIKESLRLSDDLDNRLNQLAALRGQDRLNVVKWWAGNKLLVMLAFSSDCTEVRANAIINRLQLCPAVEKVVAASAYNLEFKPGDFARSYNPNETIPDVARRGLDRERLNHAAYVPPDRDDLAHTPHVPNRLIVRWKDESIWRAAQTGFLQQMADLHQATGCRVVRDIRRSGTRLSQLLEFDGDPDALAEKLSTYMNSGWVQYAQPDIVYHATAGVPNDPVYNAPPGPQWSLPLIHGPEAWALQKGDTSVIIAVADSGAPVNTAPAFPGVTPHPDFQDPSHALWNIWAGQNTIVIGETRNFHDANNDVTDDWTGVWHGTHVASIIGARGNNALGMTGVAWNVSLMILKVLGECGNFGQCAGSPLSEQKAFSTNVSRAVSYASGYQATAINCSFFGNWRDKNGFQNYDPEVTAAIAAAREAGMLVVAAAVNAGADNDENSNLNTPQLLPLDNVIVVGATTIDDQRPGYSNYGIYRVDLGAPGGASNGGPTILGLKPTFNGNSADPGNYNLDWGTSFAAPHVSGAVALVKSNYPWETYLGVKDRILMGVEHLTQFDTQFRTKGRLNLFRALHKRTLIRNISTRAFVGSGEQVLIGGFAISGATDPGAPLLKVCVRGLGPSVGVSPVFANPKIQILGQTASLSVPTTIGRPIVRVGNYWAQVMIFDHRIPSKLRWLET